MWIDGRLLIDALSGMVEDERFSLVRLEMFGCSPFVLEVHGAKRNDTVMYALIVGAMPAREKERDLYYWVPTAAEEEVLEEKSPDEK